MLPEECRITIPPIQKGHPRLALGCWALGGKDWGHQTELDSLATMATAWSCGIRHCDTALAYGNGLSEKLCGQFLAEKWDDVVIASKGQLGRRPESIIKALHKSLRHLGTGRIDLYYMHYPKSDVDMRPHLELLEKERQKGTIQVIGASNFSVEQLAALAGAGRIDVVQMGYNLLWRAPEKDLIPYCRENGIGILSYCSLAQGILTGKFPLNPRFDPDDLRPKTVPFRPAVWPRVHRAVEQLKRIADEFGFSLSHLAIRWLAERPEIAALVVGARNGRQVTQNVAAFASHVPSRALAEATAISDSLQSAFASESSIFGWYP